MSTETSPSLEYEDALRKRVAELEATLAAVTAERDKFRRAYEALKGQLELVQRRIFVAKAERIDTRQLELEFAELKAKLEIMAKELGDDVERDVLGDEDDPKAPRRRKPTGRRDLGAIYMPEERVEITDPTLEGVAERIGFEESFLLGYRRGGPVRIVMARATYKTAEHDDGTTGCVANGNANVGQSCDQEHCSTGLTCLGQAGSRKCLQLCKTKNGPTCAANQICKTSPIFPDPTIGFCAPAE